MPNWCSNEIIIKGDNENLQRLFNLVKTDDIVFDFNAVIPYPEEFAKLDADGSGAGFRAGGFEWRMNNWGTSWNTEKDSGLIAMDDGEVVAYFLSAWSPPLPVTIALSKLFCDLTFVHRYEEGSNDFSGVLECKNGEITMDVQGDYGEYRMEEDSYYADIDGVDPDDQD